MTKLTLYKPEIEDLWFKEQMLGDAQTMSYNQPYGGTISFPKERWKSWYDRWILNHEGKRFYRYLMVEKQFVGEIAFHFEEESQRYLADVLVYAPYRGNGYGRMGLQLLCEAAKNYGIEELYDEIAADNPAVSLFLACGFSEVKRTEKTVWLKKEMNL